MPMAWKTAEEWERLKQGIGCTFCDDALSDQNGFSFKVIELNQSVVRLPRNQYMRGWTVVILKRHANELFELEPAERAGYWDEVSAVARALHAIHGPAKINYCVWGNIVPHLHCHLFPRPFTDDPGKPIDQNEREVFLDRQEYQRMIADLRGRIGAGG
jgi:diadenosine tetraphosphate (Ap4A) HIT family hydrolase